VPEEPARECGYLTTDEAENYMGVHIVTLRKWALKVFS
jgi:hypothetical protein